MRFTITSLANIFGIDESKYFFINLIQLDCNSRNIILIKQKEFFKMNSRKEMLIKNIRVVIDVIGVYLDLQLAADANSNSFPSPIDVIS